MCNRVSLYGYKFNMYQVAFLLYTVSNAVLVLSQQSSTPFISPSQNCSYYCADRFLNDYNFYNLCLRNCTSSWPFIKGNDDECWDHSMLSNATNIACPPYNFELHLVNRTLPDGVKSYALYSWQPCSAAIEYVTSFTLGITGGHLHRVCYNLQLKPNLTLDKSHRNVQYLFMDPVPLLYRTEYRAQLRALPNFESHPSPEKIFWSPSCQDLNTPYSCVCVGEGHVKLRPLTVTVSGYNVSVEVIPAEDCFKVIQYDIFIFSETRNMRVTNVESQSANSKNITRTFTNIYETDQKLAAEVVAIRNQGAPASRVFPIEKVKAWKPVLPTVTFPTLWSSPRVSFEKATNYSIQSYDIRLTKHDYLNGVIVTNKTVASVTVDATSDRNISRTFYGLENKVVYSVQIRENRRNRKTKFFTEAEWGPSKTFVVRKPPQATPFPATNTTNLAILLPVVIVVLFTAVIVSFIVFLYFWKRGSCPLFRRKLPADVVVWLDRQTVQWKSRTVLLVWQTDFRSSYLQEKHADVISRFSTFLSRVCNLFVILDLYDERELSLGISDWVQKSYDVAEMVIFVCPHFNYNQEKENLAPLTGDFRRMYRYVEGELGDRSKYITVLLPYSDLHSSRSTEYLQRMTSLYTLMDKIEDLYFHIQGFSRFDCWGKHGAVNISDRDYRKTPEGAALYHSIKEFEDMLERYSRASSLTGSSSIDSQDDVPSTSSDSRSCEEENKLLADKAGGADAPNSIKEVPVMIHSLSRLEGPSPTDQLIERERPPLKPITPFVENPEEELLRINQRPNEELIQEVDYCPYHSGSDVILSSRSLPSVVGCNHSRAYGQDSRSFHIVDFSHEEESSKDTETPVAHPDSGFGSTRV